MATRNLRSNSSATAIWPIGVQLNASASDETELPEIPIMAAAANVEWKTDPCHGNFNPGTKIGQSIFQEKTKGLPEASRLELSKSNSSEIHKFFRSKEGQMGALIAKVPFGFEADGVTVKTANLLSQYHQLSLEDLQRSAHAYFNTTLALGTAIPATPFTARTLAPATSDPDKADFYKQVDSAVVAKLCENCLSSSGYNDLMLQKDKFSYLDSTTGQVKYDGPTMIFLIYQTIDPNTIVGLDNILKKLERAKLGDYNNDVAAMLKDMQTWRLILKENNCDPENYRRMLLDALTTGPNHTYNGFITRIVDDVESGIGANANITADNLIVAAKARYNNMDDKSEWTSVDPRDSQILALATQLNEIRATQQKQSTALATAAAGNANGSNGAYQDDKFYPKTTVEKWRGIRDGPTKKGPNGKMYYWCKHHIHPDGVWDGLYVQHLEKDCRKIGGSGATPGAKPAAAAAAPKNALQLQQNLKNVLCTNLCMSSEDVDKLFEKAAEN